MSNTHVINVQRREDEGKGASRRLRTSGNVPAIVYGGELKPVSIQLNHNEVWLASQNDWFYSSILDLSLNGDVQKVLLRDVQRHPYKQQIMHLDFQRVNENETLRTAVPLHFVGQEKSPAGKSAEIVVTHELNEVVIECLPKDLPEFIEVDLSELAVGAVIHLSEVKLPAGVSIPELKLGKEHDVAVVIAKHGRVEAEPEAEGQAEQPAEVPASKVAKKEEKQPPRRGTRPRGSPGTVACIFAMAGLRLIVGLGNPGSEHAKTRHNAGFRFVDALAEGEGVRFGVEGKLFGETVKVHVADEAIWLLKPSTYMNLSGKSVTAALRYWKIAPEEMLVAHDELDLPPGTARLKFDGGHGGQNGLRDIIRLLGHGKFHRLRIGIGHPGHRDKVTPWVLGKPGKDDEVLIGRAIADAIAALPLAVRGNHMDAMTRLHTPKGE